MDPDFRSSRFGKKPQPTSATRSEEDERSSQTGGNVTTSPKDKGTATKLALGSTVGNQVTQHNLETPVDLGDLDSLLAGLDGELDHVGIVAEPEPVWTTSAFVLPRQPPDKEKEAAANNTQQKAKKAYLALQSLAKPTPPPIALAQLLEGNVKDPHIALYLKQWQTYIDQWKKTLYSQIEPALKYDDAHPNIKTFLRHISDSLERTGILINKFMTGTLSATTDVPEAFAGVIDEKKLLQAAAAIHTKPKLDDEKTPYLYIEDFASAPWNVVDPSEEPEKPGRKGAGTALMKLLVNKSIQQGYKGRLMLFAIGTSVDWYIDYIGFERLKGNVLILTEAKAQKLLAKQ